MTNFSEHIFPSKVKKGVVKNNDKVIFLVENKSEYDFESYKQNCGCLGVITLEPRKLDCELVANYKDANTELLTDGFRSWKPIKVGAVTKYFNIDTSTYEIDLPDDLKSIKVTEFSNTIPVSFKDGRTEQIIDESGKLKDNPDKCKAYVEVLFYVTKE
jgi:hypothetical protein